MNGVYLLYDEVGDESNLVGAFSTPEKALEVMNEKQTRYEIYAIPLDKVDCDKPLRQENRCKLIASEFRFMTRKLEAHAKATEIFARATRKDILKAILDGGAKLVTNNSEEIEAEKHHESRKTDFYWGVPIKWEFGEME